ncbi:MAG: glycosyltransferase family 2 protein [Candidatus Thermoplasmatota archaeon]|nr:glycosyltransferase family 2 protein [Candidatus Thermoplasmatota archaeon]MDD5778357.1 glycosyltransferase family 2 protein [Candidatus Thermoplasmatota archaeon]
MNDQQFDYVIPTYNSADTLEKCLSDIKRYGCPNEIICPDKFSDDGTRDIVERHGAQVIDCGTSLGEARRIGAHEASTEWIGFVDSDVFVGDEWPEVFKYIDEKIGAIQANPNHTFDKGSGLPYFLDIKPKLFGIYRPFTGATLIRRDLVTTARIMEDCQAFEDWFLGRHVCRCGFDWLVVPVNVYHVEDHHESVRKRAWHAAALRRYLLSKKISMTEFFKIYLGFILFYLGKSEMDMLLYWFRGLIDDSWFEMER